MGDLISRTRLKEELRSWAINIINPKYYLVEDADFVIDTQAAVDAVEIVRCKDCKAFGREIMPGKHACEKYMMPHCRETDYCSYGERKEK